MKVEFLIENIEEFLPTIAKVLPVHSQIPVLSNLLIEANEKGLFLSATNLEIGIRVKIPAKIEEGGATTVPGKQFIEALLSLPKDKVILSQEKDNLVLKSRGSSISFQTISRDEFPTLLENIGEKTHVFAEGELSRVFSKVIFAVSLDESRPELTGILIAQKKERIDFVATDGFRLSLKKLVGKKIFTEERSLIIPARIIAEVMGFKTGGNVAMYLYGKTNQVVFETENAVLVGRLISGDFPNYERVVPSKNKTKITLDREEFVQKLRLASVFARDAANIVKVKIEKEEMGIFSKASGVGEGEVTLEVEKEGEDNEISFNVKFLTDLLKNLSSKTVHVELSSPVEPAVFKIDDDPDFLHIIMPVRIQD